MPNIGFQEIILILVVALIIFGPKKLPEIGKSLGQGLREFKKVSNDLMSSIENIGDEPEVQTKTEETTYQETVYQETEEEKPEEVASQVTSKEGDA